MHALLQPPNRLVAFVGAGASAIAPSLVPTWKGFNDLLLECLCERLAEFSRGRQPTGEMLRLFRERRDGTAFFAPDFQAQLIEEEIGAEYFEVWKSISTETFGPAHAALAELAAAGRLAAVVTTNFDQLIEIAMRERQVACEVVHDERGFAALAARGDAPSTAVPVVKIHGSLGDSASLVDTLRQRVVGRPASLQPVLQRLLRSHPWMFLGFSGADFSYDANYLGILGAAPEATGFVFLAREGATIEPGVERLHAAYGAQKSAITRGNLADWLTQTFGLPARTWPAASAGEAAAATARVRAAIAHWVQQLGPMAVTNIVHAMLKAAQIDSAAHWLMRKTWKSYRTPGDTTGKSYARYNYNYGLALFEAGFIRNPVALAGDFSNMPEWKAHADQNAFEFLARSYQEGIIPAGAQLASLLALRGEVGRGIGLASEATDQALAQKNGLAYCDVALGCFHLYDIVRLPRVIEGVVAQLQRCLAVSKELGDEPRRARVCVQLARFLTSGGHGTWADELMREAQAIGERLELGDVLLWNRAARGRWLTDCASDDEQAVQTLRGVVDALHASGNTPLYVRMDLGQPDATPQAALPRHPMLCRALLDLNRAARFAGNAEVMNQTLDELDELVTASYPGYYPHYLLSYAECLLHRAEGDPRGLVMELLKRARSFGEESQNPWVAEAVARIESDPAHRG